MAEPANAMRAHTSRFTRAPVAGGRRLRGVSLIEVLVSLVVVSVGTLSATSLQIVSKRNNREAAQRLEATHLASTMIERMRANSSPAALSAYVSTASQTIGLGRLHETLQLNCAERPAECCTAESHHCTTTQVVAVDLWQWEQIMDGRMETVAGSTLNPGGLDTPTACITGPNPAGRDGFYTVTIAFRGTLAIADNPDPNLDCGRDAAYDGTPLYGANNELRRTLTVSAYITPTVAK